MVDIGARLRQRREQLGWTGTKVATLAGISQPFLSRLESGAVGYSQETVMKVAGALGLPMDKLYANGSNVEDAVPDFRLIPVIDYVQAGKWTSIQEDVPDGGFQERISTNLECPPSTFALRIRGDSMEPRFTAGDIVVVNPMLQPKPGDFVVATDESGEATFKQYRDAGRNAEGKDAFELIPLNALYGPLRSDRQSIAIVGVMVEHRTYRKR